MSAVIERDAAMTVYSRGSWHSPGGQWRISFFKDMMFKDEGEANWRGIIPGRGNNMDKGPVLVLKEAHPVWSPESEVSRVDHVAEVEQEPDHTGLFGSWKDFGINARARPNAEGLFFFPLSPISSLSFLPEFVFASSYRSLFIPERVRGLLFLQNHSCFFLKQLTLSP